MRKYLSVAKVAEMIGVDKGKVLAWLQRGELKGIRLPHQGKKSSKPRDTDAPKKTAPGRWRIPLAAIEEFEAANSNVKPPAQKPTKRRARETVAAGSAIKQFYT